MNAIRKDRLILAPMAGISNAALRRAFDELGWFAGWIGSIDSRAAARRNDGRLVNMLGRIEDPAPRPNVVQLIGGDPAETAEAVGRLDEAADAFDINLGCPLGPAVDRGMGSALLDDPGRMLAVLKSAAAHSKKPVTAKIRLPETPIGDPGGWARRLEDTGISALIIHARRPSQGFRGPARWAAVRFMKNAVSVPVAANGGLRTIEDIRACLDETGCDAVMIGAGAMRNPGLAGEWRAAPAGERNLPPSSPRATRAALARAYARAAGGPLALRRLEYLVLMGRVQAFRIRRHGPRPRGDAHAGR